jgi:mono/diheme cytochrome c family protein
MKGIYVLIFGFILIISSCADSKNDSMKKPPDQAKKVEPAQKTHPGKMIYMQFCLACHMENGQGVPGLYPTLVKTEWIGDKTKMIENVLKGLEGPIVVNGEPFNNVMAKLDYLGDKEIADVLTYVRSNFGNNEAPVTISDVSAVRASLPK